MQILTTSQNLEPTILNPNLPLFKSSIEAVSGLSSDTHTYEYTFETSLKHSNATQNIYFSNYVEWQGTVRERWFFDCIDNSMLKSEGAFVTKEVHQLYMKEGFPFTTIVCHLNSFRIQRCGFRLLFRFYADDELISYGYQHLVFTNHSKKIVRLPMQVVDKIEDFYLPIAQHTS